ncbi:MAG TPA: outer membrane beta-barrel protein [Candidatus Sulfotelmatobacter sp.]|jgi:opacity protein-like surface antigen|nr:outer membrane beta-barrel protein [Candidatus Sulfotelmatobacter sp.]
MIRKFRAVPQFDAVLKPALMMILAGTATLFAQQTQPTPSQQPQTQQPRTQQPQVQQPESNQEATPEESTPIRKSNANQYNKWTFNVGGGASLTNGNTANFVRSGGGIAAAGIARNGSKYLGLRLDFQWDNLPLKSSALQAAQATGANSHVYSLLLDPIINIPASTNWGGYLLAGPAFYHRSGKLDSSTAIPGSACDTFFLWWGHCFNGSLPIDGNFLHSSQNEFGYNFGGGITRKIRPNMDLYVEFRYLHGKHDNVTTDLRPITIGVRW